MTTERVYITQIQARNWKKLREFALTPTGEITVIEGQTGQGKSSVLQLIEATFRGADPECVTKGEDKATLFLQLSDGTTIERIIREGQPDALMVQRNGQALPPASAKAFLKTLTGETTFDPISWVELGGKRGEGKTAARREQRDTLLRAIPMEISSAEIGQAIRDLGHDAAKVAELIQMPEGLFSHHALVVCDTLRQVAYDVRTQINRTADEKEEDLKRTPAVEGEVPSDSVADLVEAERAALESYQRAVGAQTSREGTAQRLAQIKARVEVTREMLARTPAVNLDEVNQRITATSNLVEDLQQQIETLRGRQAEAERELAGLKQTRSQTQQLIDEWARLTSSAEADDREIAEIEKSLGQAVQDPAPLKERYQVIQAMRMKRQQQDAHESAAAEWLKAKNEALALTHIIELFRDTLPKRILDRAALPIPGLGIDGETLTIDGIPLHQKGTSEQIRIGVQVAVALNPACGFICVDGIESMGAQDLAALHAACQEFGVQIIATEVMRGDVSIGDRVVMVDGKAAA